MKQYDLLIIDDERRFADMLAKRLNLRGCECEVCYSGREALAVLKRKNFSLVILDLHLPDLYGSEVLSRIKKINAQIPVIILTAHGTQKDRQECMQKGAYDFMQKPLVIEKLMATLAQIGQVSA
jgi:DNA-binding NtrC family response regulator